MDTVSFASTRASESKHLLHEGILHFRRGDWVQALRCFDRLLENSPDSSELLNYRARALEGAGRLSEALETIEHALAVSPRDFTEIRNRAILLTKLGRLTEALNAFDRALQMRAEDPEILAERAYVLLQLGVPSDALASADQAMRYDAEHVSAGRARALALEMLGREQEAQAAFAWVLKRQPKDARALNDYGRLLVRAGCFLEALASYDQSLALNPNDETILYNRCMARLSSGDWDRGLREFEIRWKIAPAEARQILNLGRLWLGEEDLQGKTVLLHHEMGYGDTLQFARYVPLVVARGAHVLLAVPAALKSLMRTLPGSPEILSTGNVVPPRDFLCPLMSLPLAFRTVPETIPSEAPYLWADPTKVTDWRCRLGSTARVRIGFAWCGRRQEPINHARDMPLDRLRPLFELRAEFISLQKECSADDETVLAALPHVRRFEGALHDFSDTAALIQALDLVITVDSAIAHLAGALGKPVWLMNRFASCWRWLQVGTATRWYPSMRIFRQSPRAQWGEVVDAVCEAARGFIGEHEKERDRACAEAQLRQARAEHEQGHFHPALRKYERVLSLAPRDPNVLQLAGVAAAELERWEQAIGYLQAAIPFAQDDPGLYSNLGNALRGAKRYADALAAYERALFLKESFAEAHNNRGTVLTELDRFDEAEGSYRRALQIRPNYTEAYANLGALSATRGRYREALDDYARAISIRPDDPLASWNKALAHLARGEFKEGWRLHEYRWNVRSLKHVKRFPDSRWWHGEEGVAGKRILLHAEQGYGDTLQFCRYAALLADRGARIVLEVPAVLKRLLQSLSGVETTIARGDPIPPFDLHCPLLSLPKAFGTELESIPSASPYLRADSELRAMWRQRLGPSRGLRVGLAWFGRGDHGNDRRRSMAVGDLKPLWDGNARGVEFVSLQPSVRPVQGESWSRLPLRHFAEHLTDFAQTAALMCELDVIVSVDTAVAHLAGALGKPVWILLPGVADWRWLLERDDSPWYPTARLFRQRSPRGWGGVVERVSTELRNFRASSNCR